VTPKSLGRELRADELHLLAPLVDAYRFKRFRDHRGIARRAAGAVMVAEIRETLDHVDGLVLTVRASRQEAVAVARVLAWETEFFRVPMGRIEYVLAPTADAWQAALREAVRALRARGVRHVSLRLDVADLGSVSIAESEGFRLMDALVTYGARLDKEAPREFRAVGRVRPLAPNDIDQVLDVARHAFRAYPSRFHADPHLPDDRCDALYDEWARKVSTGEMADMVVVAEASDGTLLGFLAWRRCEPVSSIAGVPVWGGGLGACRLGSGGAFGGLIRAAWGQTGVGIADCQTQISNVPTIRVYEAVGLRYCRAEYTLHRWLS